MNRPNELNPTPIDRNHFQVQGNTLVAFASDIASLEQCSERGCPWLQAIFTDAADVGLAIHRRYVTAGQRETVRFYLDKEDVMAGDLRAWHFKPCRVTEAGGIKEVIIFND